MRSYSDAQNVIQRAMLDAIRNGPSQGEAAPSGVRELADLPPKASASGADPIPMSAKRGIPLPLPILIALGFAALLLGVGGVEKLRAHFARERGT